MKEKLKKYLKNIGFENSGYEDSRLYTTFYKEKGDLFLKLENYVMSISNNPSHFLIYLTFNNEIIYSNFIYSENYDIFLVKLKELLNPIIRKQKIKKILENG